MNNISGDEIIQNIKKVTEKYQEILLLLMQGKGAMLPNSLIDNDKARIMFANVYEQFISAPQKFLSVNTEYTKKFQNLVSSTIGQFISGNRCDPLYTPHKKDRRFKDDAWENNIYFDFVKQFYLMSGEWIEKTINQYELEPELKLYLEFITHQFIDAVSPSNFIFSNPTVLKESLENGWQNIVQGLDNFLEDIKKSGDILNIQTTDKSSFKIGQNIAATKGKVVFQNDLMQLICYEPKDNTYSVPLLIVPSWINKYYILDLSEKNSMVSFLVNNNFQVFMISWINPDEKLKHKNFEDYLKEGILDPCEYIAKLRYKKINIMGYCIAGTLLATALAYMKANKLDYVSSASFITTLLDFSKPGEIGTFINETSILAIEAEMALKGYFDGRYLSNSFNLLRANDLVWSFFVNNYLLGKSPIPFDILYWNADSTNLPASMNSYYLRNMYLNNLLKEPGHLQMLRTPIDLSKVDYPSFFLAAHNDHIALWNAAYESAKLLKGNKVFCLTDSGHIAGVVNPPEAEKYSYRTNNNLTLNHDQWLATSKEHQGSWWVYWKDWLIDNSNKLEKSIDYNNMDFIEDAPGSYVQGV